MRRCAIPLLLALAACGPVSRETAEFQCRDQARLAEKPRGSVAVGAGSGGLRSRVAVEIGGDFIAGRDPAAVYAQCVARRSGEMLARSYAAIAG